MNLMPKKVRVALVREDLVALTKDTNKAIALGQFIYWAERMKDVDKYISEETDRLKKGGIEANLTPSYGWIYKEAEEFIEETMLTISRPTANRLLKSLVEDGYLFLRKNPDKKWDQTNQYRVNFLLIQEELRKLGYWHSELAWLTNGGSDDDPSEMIDATLKMSNAMINLSNGDLQAESAKNPSKDAMFKMSDASIKVSNASLKTSNRMSQNERAIPEITSEINNDDNNNARARVDQNLTMKNQQPNNSIGVKDQNDPNETLSPPLRPLDTFTSDDSGVDVFTAMVGLTSPPPSDGQAPISPKLTLTLDELNEIYRMVEARMTAYTFPQKKKPYMLTKDDYTKLHNLLYSQVPLDFIL